MGHLTVSYDAIQYLDPGADAETEGYRKGVMKYEQQQWVGIKIQEAKLREPIEGIEKFSQWL